MSQKACANLLITELEGITSPATPSVVRKVPSQHGNDIPSAIVTCWINLEAIDQDRSDEPNKSGLRGYGFMAHYWYSCKAHSLETTADVQMDMADALLDKLGHNTLGGYARIGIAYNDMDKTQYDGGEDDNTTYVVRSPFIVWRQE